MTLSTAYETVQRLAELRPRKGLQVSVNHTVISARSLEDHETLCRQLDPLGVDVHAVLAYADSAMYGAKRFGKKAADLLQPTGYPCTRSPISEARAAVEKAPILQIFPILDKHDAAALHKG